jgi:putative ABC transport system permease protein
MLDGIIGDVRFAIRTLARTPTFTAGVVLTVGLAVGATSSIFAVVDGIVLRPLPFPGAERTSQFCETNPAVGDHCVASPANVADWARGVSALEAAGVARAETFVARIDGQAAGIRGAIASPGFFHVLGLHAALGRLIADGDLPRGANQVALLSHAFWQRRLGGDPAVVGRAVMLDDKPCTVIGVLGRDAYVPTGLLADVEVWKPLTASVDDVGNRSWRGFLAIGRRAASVPPEALAAELDTVRARLTAAYPAENAGWGLRTVDLREAVVGDVRPVLSFFLGAAALVLLIACANVANLLLVRAAGRATELALRASLGATRRRLVQQVITESLLLSLAGGALGLLVASWVTAAFMAAAPSSIPRLDEVAIDGRVAAFAFAVAAAAALVFGLAPARRAATLDLNATLKESRLPGAADGRVRSAFVVAQLSLALVLLVGMGLLARTFGRLSDWDPGFDRSDVVTTWMLAPERASDKVALMERVRDEVQSIPGVRSASLASAGPLFGGVEPGRLTIAGRPPAAPGDAPSVEWFDIGLRYFETLGVRVVRGRTFDAADTRGAKAVAVVNETFARRYFPGSRALGQVVTVEEHSSEIVGVVGDMRPLSPAAPTAAQIYWPIQQYRRSAAYLVVRVAPGIAIEKPVRARVAGVDDGIQLSAFLTLEERLAKNLVSPRFNLLLVSAFAIVALSLSVVGVYGVMACGVASRTRELGVRLALGAPPASLVRDVVARGMGLAALGIAAGCAGALAGGRLLASLLHGLPPSDPVTLLSATAVLAVAALVACWVPARRASRVDPVTALRAR